MRDFASPLITNYQLEKNNMSILQRFVSVPAVTLAILLGGASIAAAQSAPIVSGTANTIGVVIVPGANGATVANLGLSSNAAGPVFITSLPVTITPGNGAVLGNLSGCQVFNANGAALNSGVNIVNTVQGTNVVTLDAPLLVTGGTPTNLTVRCNVSGATPSGGTFQFSVGTPSFAPALSVVTPNLTLADVIVPGQQDAVVANVLLDATRSGTPIVVTTIPLMITSSDGGSTADLTDCRVRNTANGNAVLNTNSSGLVTTGSNVITLNSPFTVSAGSAALLSVTCDISPTAVNGATYLVGVTPTILAATNGSGVSVVPTGAVAGNVTSSGVPVTVFTGATTPSVPNTGAGDPPPALTLVLSGLALALGAFYLRRKLA